MAKKTNYSFKKYEREKIRQQKKQEKISQKRVSRQNNTVDTADSEIDPDIAHIIPGPQPPADEE